MEEIPAEYELQQEKPPEIKTASVATVLIGIGVLVAIAAAIIALVLAAQGKNVISQQSAQIRALDASNTRMAGEITALSNRQTQMSAKLSASDPSSDKDLITCQDWHSLTKTTGGSVSVTAVPSTATVSLSQNRVSMPGHCR